MHILTRILKFVQAWQNILKTTKQSLILYKDIPVAQKIAFVKKGSNERICRYKFPKELIQRSQIIRTENGKFEFQLKRNDARMNSHSPFVTCHWRANTDENIRKILDSIAFAQCLNAF